MRAIPGQACGTQPLACNSIGGPWPKKRTNVLAVRLGGTLAVSFEHAVCYYQRASRPACGPWKWAVPVSRAMPVLNGPVKSS